MRRYRWTLIFGLAIAIGFAAASFLEDENDGTSPERGAVSGSGAAAGNAPAAPAVEPMTEEAKLARSAEAVESLPLDPKIVQETKEEKQPLDGVFDTTVETELNDDGLRIRFALQNVSGRELVVNHGSGQQYDIFVLNEAGETVYQWSWDKAFTLALVVRDFAADERMDFEETWDLKNADGERVPAGTYTVKVQVMVGLEEGKLSPGQLTAETEIDIAGP